MIEQQWLDGMQFAMQKVVIKKITRGSGILFYAVPAPLDILLSNLNVDCINYLNGDIIWRIVYGVDEIIADDERAWFGGSSLLRLKAVSFISALGVD